MIFGMCATRVIGFVVGFCKDIIALRNPVQNAPVNGTAAAGGAKVEEVSSSMGEKKEL